MPSARQKPIAFLGPAGTHSEVALQTFLGRQPSEACYSIPEVFDKVAHGQVSGGFVPIENMLQGPVAETLDSLLRYRDQVHISAGYLLPIRHALGVLRADPPHAVCRVYSHEQALRQCAKHLRENYPEAELVAVASTGQAAALVQREQLTDAAVIAPESTLREGGFQILAPDISDMPVNKTRFVLLRPGKIEDQSLHLELPAQGEDKSIYVTSIVVDPGRDRQGLFFDLLKVISVDHHLNLLSLHSRPNGRGGFVFHIDLEGHFSRERIRDCIAALRRFAIDETGETVAISIFGSYLREQFEELPFATVGIIGGEGVMGRWFRRFFAEAGLRVFFSDLQTEENPASLAAKCDVLLLSVPMSGAAGVAAEVAPLLRPGQLIVENCSIKSAALPELLQLAPEGVEVLGLHTMFGGDIPAPKGENVIFTPTERSGPKSKALEDLFYKYGAKISYSPADYHDHVTSVVQSLVQLLMLALAEVEAAAFSSLAETDVYSTPNFRNINGVMLRVLAQNEELTLDLQRLNGKAVAMRHRLLESLFRLVAALDRGELDQLRHVIERGRDFVARSGGD